MPPPLCPPPRPALPPPLSRAVPAGPLLPQRHVGARVAGEWSRFDLQQAPRTFGKAGIPSFSAVLPTAARDLYFRDAIGNISSSGGLTAGLFCWQPCAVVC